MTNRIIVVGSGIAGITALKSIREIDRDSELIVIGDELFYPYYRLKLSKGLFGELSEDNMLIQKKDWYIENKINVCLGKKVTGISTDKKEVVLSDKSALSYDKLLFANGAGNFRPPIEGIDKPGVFSLRTLQDALDIKGQIKKDEHVVVIGGGIQGLETAWSLHRHGAGVSIVELLPRLMPNQLDERASEILKQSIENFGINVFLNTKVSSIYGNNGVEGIMTGTGELLPCRKVIYSVGIRPNIDIVRNTSIAYRKGIIVDEKMETNIKGIYAAGDIAEFNNNVAGSWNISMAYGKVAGYNIAGKESVYQQIVPVTTLNAFKLTLFSMGNVDESKASNIVPEENNEGQYIKILMNDGRAAGAIVIGDTRRSPILKTAIEKGISLRPLDYSKITVSELINKLNSEQIL